MTTVWCILYCERNQKKDIAWQIYDICATEEKAKERLQEIKEEEGHDKKFKIEDWNVRD